MNIETTALMFEGGTINDVMVCDTIAYEGKKWLVLGWIHNRASGKSWPTRIVCLDRLEHRPWTGKGRRADYVLTKPLPKAVVSGPIQQQEAGLFEVIDNPEVKVDTREIPSQR